jgi:hypothetical protein
VDSLICGEITPNGICLAADAIKKALLTQIIVFMAL